MRSRLPPGARGPDPHGWYTYTEAARFAGVAPRTLYRWVATGRVPSPDTRYGTERFSGEAVGYLMDGPMAVGTYPVAPSENRDRVAKIWAEKKRKAAKKAKAKPKGKDQP